jgi:hypothetical protein
MSVVVHLVTDRDAGDPVGADLLRCLAPAFPGALVSVTRVARGDTLSAGSSIALLARSDGAAARLVAHDIAAAPGQPDPWPAGAGEQLCVGRSVAGALVVGANRGWTWSFVVADLRGLCRLDVPAAGGADWPARLAAALAHAHRRHPHAVAGALSRSAVPPLPDRIALDLPARRASALPRR